ncbi:MAG: Gfo/Idh/MocA family oxidoreductase [Planctomycetes bacterium]|nr:Gfo/Idh/MocA family oxidoreductase [Planctomycetota bacterium]
MRLGVVGYGSRMHHVLRYLCKLHHEASVVAIVDPREEEIRQRDEDLTETRLIENYGADYKNIVYYKTIQEMLDTAEVDGVLIGTRCNTHTDIAIEVMKKNIPIFLEKPVCTTVEQVQALYQASLEYKSQAVISFPLRMSTFAQKTRQLIESGIIGKVRQVEAINHVTYGAGYFHGHYRDFEETGGLWLQKATHDLDVVSYLLDSRPKTVAAMHSVNQVYGGDKPAGLTCNKCPEKETCKESPFYDYFSRSGADVMGGDRLCVFGEEVGELEDHCQAMIQYECGAQVSFVQNFYIRKTPRRGVRVIGYDGHIEFDYYKSEIIHVNHHTRETNIIKISDADAHGGGDPYLANNFIHIMRGDEDSKSPLLAGIESAYLCLLCRESAEKQEFLQVPALAALRETEAVL